MCATHCLEIAAVIEYPIVLVCLVKQSNCRVLCCEGDVVASDRTINTLVDQRICPSYGRGFVNGLDVESSYTSTLIS